MKVLQINVTINSGSTGRIAEDVGNVAIENGFESFIAFGRGNRPSKSEKIQIGNQIDIYLHGFKTLFFDKHGFGSKSPTESLIRTIETINPDIICLHNLHGYYLNINVLFEYLRKSKIPAVWILYDCWAFTGHCTYFDDIQCPKWKIQCYACPKINYYPRSLVDNSINNYNNKKRLFSGIDNLEIIVHSKWLEGLVKESFLNGYKINVAPSAIDLDLFKPTDSNLCNKYGFSNKKILLGCANIWSERKGLNDFISLQKRLDENFQIVLIGLNAKQIKELPFGVLGIARTESIEELAQWYTIASVFINPTYQDNFPTTNLEALACGTPVITYDTGGSPEAIDEDTGIVVSKGDIDGIKNAIESVILKGREHFQPLCRARAEKHFDKDKRYQDYIHLFESKAIKN